MVGFTRLGLEARLRLGSAFCVVCVCSALCVVCCVLCALCSVMCVLCSVMERNCM